MEKLEYRAVIKFLTKEGNPYTKIHERLVAVYGDSVPSVETVRRWSVEFSRGRQSIEGDPRSGIPATAQNDTMVANVENMVLADRRIGVKQISDTLQISVGSVHSIIHDQLNMNKVSARWVPRMLTSLQKQNRMNISQQLLERVDTEKDGFFTRLVTMDEVWVYHYDPETKQKSKQWRHPFSPPPRKFKTAPSAGKVMASVFWDCRGVILLDFLPQGSTITGQYYATLLEQLAQNLNTKRCGLRKNGILLLHDNAPAHASVKATTSAKELGFKILPHPPYSPDLAPSDFHLFGPLKNSLRGIHFGDDESVKAAVEQWLGDQLGDFYNRGIYSLIPRWQKCVAFGGDYVEKS